jgi:threonine synthase
MKSGTVGATHLECTRCGSTYESERLWRLSPCCERPLYRATTWSGWRTFRPEQLRGREPTLWRYAEVLPVRNERSAASRWARVHAAAATPRWAAASACDGSG